MYQKANFLFFLLILLGVSAPLSAYAADEEETVEIEMNIPVKGFSRYAYTVQMFNNPRVSESNFTLRLGSPGSIVGCATTTDAEHSTKINSGSLKLEVTDPELEIPGKRRYGQYDCVVKNNVSIIDIPLSRDELIENKITKLKLKSKEYGDFLDSEVRINKQKIEISATANGQSYNVSFWFYPKNTVMLHAPQTSNGSDTKSFIRDFGKSLGLTELEHGSRLFGL